jgi:prolyl 4-hydroxylase
MKTASPLSASLWITFLFLTLGITFFWPDSYTSLVAKIRKPTEATESCSQHRYETHIFSKDPLVIYISDFLTPKEASDLIHSTYVHVRHHGSFRTDRCSGSTFKASGIINEEGRAVNTSIRSSHSAVPPRTDTVKCIEQRAAAFQGFGSLHGRMERLQVVKYEVSQEFRQHYDWSADRPRETTFFAYLEANCTGGGTNFPLLDAPKEDRWCEFIDCDESFDAGVTFKPIAGNAIFWQNLRADGEGYEKTLHAGIPVTSGTKVGLNIWSLKRVDGES